MKKQWGVGGLSLCAPPPQLNRALVLPPFVSCVRVQADSSIKGVVLSGATGPLSVYINGVFAPTGKEHNGKPLFQKVGDGPDRWLCYNTNDQWMVMDTADKEANNRSGRCHSVKAGLPHPTLAMEWNVAKDGKFVAEAGMSAKVSPVKYTPWP